MLSGTNSNNSAPLGAKDTLGSSLLAQQGDGGNYDFEAATAPPVPPRPAKDVAPPTSSYVPPSSPAAPSSSSSLPPDKESQQPVAPAAATAGVGSRAPNWPPKPWPKPFVHQDIAGEIPAAYRVVARIYYLHWLVTPILLLYNLACILGALIGKGIGNIGDLILAGIYFPIWSLLTWLIWRLFYTAARKTSALLWFFFFAALIVQIAVDIAALVGWEKSGWCGIEWTLVLATSSHPVQAFMGLANSIAWGASLALCIYVFVHARVAYHKAGGLKAAGGQAAGVAVKAAADHPDIVFQAASTAATAAHDFESK